MNEKKNFPHHGLDKEQLLEELRNRKAADIRWREGRHFAYIYYPGDEDAAAIREAYEIYFSENGLNPSAFPSLRKLEVEVIEMTADLLGGDAETVGTMTSGGTESILMAVKTAREWARAERPEIDRPEIVLPATAHPAFHKACHYFGLQPVVVPVGDDYRAIPERISAAISPQTVLLVASAPSYPQGVIDPISDIAALAAERKILCHIDACVGGFILPFLRSLGRPIPPFDLSVPGVTSISADIHKYGYAAKGASVVLYRDSALRKHQFYVYTDWSGGIYGSPAVTGTRPGGAIAAAWTALQYFGREGYEAKARQCLEVVEKIRVAVEDLPDVYILGQPDMTILALASDSVDIYEVGDELGLKGWYLDRQQHPACLHLTITPSQVGSVDAFLTDLRAAVEKSQKWSLHGAGKKLQLGLVKGLKKALPPQAFAKLQELAGQHLEVGSGGRTAAMYGMMGALKGDENLEKLVRSFLDKMFR